MRNPNGYGSVYKLSGNRRRPWVARITVGWTDADWENNGGKSKQIYKMLGYYKTRKEAQIALAEYNKEPYDIDLRKITFKEVYERWSSEHFQKITESKSRAYKAIFNSSEPLHAMPFNKIKTTHLQEFINKKSHLKASSLRHSKGCYQQMYKYAIKHEFAAKNYADFIDLPKDAKKPKANKVFSREDVETVFSHYENGVEHADIALLLLFTGFRIMELLSLKKTDINLADRYIVGGSKTEAGTDRVVPINHKILPIIKARMESDSEYLIPNKKGNAWKYDSFRKTVWSPLMETMGMSHTAHSTRHTFVSMMTEAGVNKLVIQRIVGHSNQDVTEHYTHLELHQLIEAIDKI